ncbi:MAG TPA: LamG-like jellyroll fold domain-containing protein [Pirellulales bacterium]|nr:LamG-like jellyroll fold domain-containing protein [Pirellulales bacterium]
MRTASAPCPPDSVLSDLALGKLDAASAETVSAHLQVCTTCRQRLAKLRSDSSVNRLREAKGAGTVADKPHPSFVPGESISHFAGDAETPPADPPLRRDRSTNVGRSVAGGAPLKFANDPDYEVFNEVGHGEIGTVYLARNRLMDRLEVLKVFRPALLQCAGVSERLHEVIRAAAALNHANIVATYRLVRLGGFLTLAMEHVDGIDLGRLVRQRGPLPIANAAYYVHQAARGLEHALQKGVLHGDIKPENLILAVEGKRHVVKISDFGLAKAIGDDGAETGFANRGQAIRAADDMAPERIVDTAKPSIRSDVYGLGCTLYFLLSGQMPFHGEDASEVATAHDSGDVRTLKKIRVEIPVELASVVAKMMAKNPAERYQTPGEVAKALVPFFKAGANAAAAAPRPVPVAATPSPQPPVIVLAPGPKPKARRPRRFAAAVGAAALLVVLCVLLSLGNKDADNLVGTQPRQSEGPKPGTPKNREHKDAAPNRGRPNAATREGKTVNATEREGPPAKRPIVPVKPVVAERESTTVSADGSPSPPINLLELKKHGAFGFPQERAQLLCDNDELRVSLWNNREHLYVQAIVWKDHEDGLGDYSLCDNSKLTLVVAPDLSITPNVDCRYHLTTRFGFSRSVILTTSERFEGGSEGRGAIRFLDLDDGQRARLDCFLVPLAEINKQPGDRLGVGFQATSANPYVTFDSQVGGGVHPVLLADNREPLNPKDVTRGLQPGRSGPENGLPEPIADFLFNGNGKDEVSAASIVQLKNVEYRDDALYVNGLHALNGGGRETTVYLGTDLMDLHKFTVALRFKASVFDATHETVLGMDSPSFFRLFRSPQGNLCVSLGQDKYLHEFTGATISAERWTTVACGVDLEAGKCVAYVNGALAGESDVPHESQLQNIGPTRHRWTFGDHARGPVYHGLVDELIVYDRLLSPAEFDRIPLRLDTTSPRVSRHPRTATAEALAEAAAKEAAANNPVRPSKLVARFLFNGNGADEMQQANSSTLRNVGFRDGAMYLEGQPLSAGGEGDAVMLVSRRLDLSHFTVAVRFKADDFADRHNYIIGADWNGWFGLSRLSTGNLAFSLSGGDFYREVQAARLEPGRWTVVACGLDLNLGKAIVYLNGSLAGEFDIPRTLERHKDNPPNNPIQFWTFQRRADKFHGLVDELLIYDQLLTHDEFAKIPLRVETTPGEGD